MESLEKFQKGEIISTGVEANPSFAIYEGKDRSEYSGYKKLSVIAYYCPNKYIKTDDGSYQPHPFFEAATKDKPCEKTVDSDVPTYWVRKCSPSEREKALEKFKEYGYEWDENELTLTNFHTGEIVYKIKRPIIKYNGEQIIPTVCNHFKSILKSFCKSKNKKTTTTYNNYSYGDDYYSNYWGRRGNGEYDDYWD